MKAKLKHLSVIVSEHDLAIWKGQTEKSRLIFLLRILFSKIHPRRSEGEQDV